MRNRNIGLGVLLMLAWAGLAAMRANAAENANVAQVLNDSVSGAEKELMSAADAMPEDKYSFAPTNGEFKGVRSFAEQLKHIAAVNYIAGASILVEKPPVDVGGESGPAALKSKGGCACNPIGIGGTGSATYLRPLRPDGRVLADEWNRASGQPLANCIVIIPVPELTTQRHADDHKRYLTIVGV